VTRNDPQKRRRHCNSLPEPADVRFVLGLMSGTSCDGVDAVIVAIRGCGLAMRVTPLAHRHEPYPRALRARLLRAMCPARTSTQELAGLHADVGRFYAAAACRAIDQWGAGRRPDLVGCHGQTICHLADRRTGSATLQIGEAAFVAAATGCPVVCDFRQADLAVGGQGAPLVPWTDLVLFGHPRMARAVQNIGGIANVTFLPAGAAPADVIAFDTGPGNMVIDELVRVVTGGRGAFDVDGGMAARGRVLKRVLSRWLRHPYFLRRPPKSAGREEFGRGFVAKELPRLRAVSNRPEDWLATATAFTAKSIVDAYRRFLPCVKPLRSPAGARRGGRSAGIQDAVPAVDEILVGGGGAANATLLAMLAGELPGVLIRPMDRDGITARTKEAISFAMLAAAFVDGVPANLPQVTGARYPAVLGKLCLPPHRRPACS